MFNQPEICKCIICNNENAQKNLDYDDAVVFYCCPVCGRYELKINLTPYKRDFDYNHLSSYLTYNGFKEVLYDARYFTNRSKEWCDEWKEKYNEGDRTHGHPVFLSNENIENWYPKTFSEKIDLIMLYLGNHVRHIGEGIKISKQSLYSILFVDRFDYDDVGKKTDRDESAMKSQAEYMLDYLEKREYIQRNSISGWFSEDKMITLYLSPEGYASTAFF